MANEIQVLHDQTGETLYAVVRRPVDGWCWKTTTSAFDDLANRAANWTDYDVALVETPAASYFYVGTFPAAIPAGFYWLDIYVRNGGAPAITDFRVGSVLGYWDGTVFRQQGSDAVAIASSTLAAQVLAAEKYSYKSDAIALVVNGASDAARGTNLIAAYATAKTMTPGGAARSGANRACVFIPPGRYYVTDTLIFNTLFVDFQGLGDRPEDTEIYADLEAAVARQTVNDIRMRNFVLRNIRTDSGMAAMDFEINTSNNQVSVYEDMRFNHTLLPFDAIGVFGTSDIRGTWRRCKSTNYSWRWAQNKVLGATMYDCESGEGSFSTDQPGAEITGWLERCRAGDLSFGGCGISIGCKISGTLVDCVGGRQCYAMGTTFSGVAIRCRGGDYSFASTVFEGYPSDFSGYAEDCRAGKGSFGGRKAGVGAIGKCSGTLVRCVCEDSELGMRLEGATIEGCLLTTAVTGESGVVLLDSLSRIIGSTILVVEGGTGIPINDDGNARSVVSAGNRFNNLGAAPLGLGPNVTNLGLLDNLDATVASRATQTSADDILADTDALNGRLPDIPASQGDVTAAHATTDGLIGGVAAGVWAVGVRSLTTFGSLVSDVTTAVWAAGTRTLTSFGALAIDVATAVWAAAARTLTAFGFVGAISDQVKTDLDAAHGAGSWEGIAEKDWTDPERKQIRDALGVAGEKVTAAGGQVQAIKAKTDTIGSVAATYTTPAVTPGGPWEIHCGSAYLAAAGRAIDLTITGYGGPSLIGAAGALRLLARHKWAADRAAAADMEVVADVSQNGTTVVLSADLSAAATAALEPSPPRDIENYRVQFRVTPDGGEPFVIGEGDLTAKKGIAAV